jgi:DMSO/TMAO reductase YedYZ molybdopterin-dependent catalytic subunit
MANPSFENGSEPGRVAAGVAGGLAAAAALAAGHLAGALTAETRSPVLVVGEGVIERVPVSVERFAIETFGSNDKRVLVAGITVVCILLGAVLGVVARRRPALAAGGFALFGVVGVLAALDRGAGLVAALAPSVVAAVAGSVTLIGLLRVAPDHRPVNAPTERPAEWPTERPKGDGLRSRRAFIAASAAAVAGVALLRTAGSAAAGRFSAAASRAGLTLPRALRPLATAPPTVEAGVDGITPFFTPNRDFYRVDTALVVPQVPAESWRLRIHGLVDRPTTLDFDQLTGRGLVEADITLTCVSNTVGGKLVGNARWLGVPLRTLLDEVGVSTEADQIVGRSVDGWTCGFPVAAAYDRSALVAIGMNGEPLPLEHGFPARLITPGLYGYVSAAKWLTEIELTTFAAFDQYWVRRGWDAEAPIKTMTRIDTPRGLARVAAGPITIGGVAWAQTRGIDKVEVRIDDGPWHTARLADALGLDTWRQWTLPWNAEPGRHTITARATDGTGELQTDLRAEPFPNGASGWQSLLVTVEQPAT